MSVRETGWNKVMGAEDNIPTTFTSPTELIKSKCVDLLFQNTEHNAKSYKEEEKYAFCCKTKDLAIYLERYTPRTKKQEVKEWYKQLEEEIKKIQTNASPTDTKTTKDKQVLEIRYKYALEVHAHNQRILLNSPIVELEAEGELNPMDEDTIETIRGKRSDVGSLVFKR